jgi:hypothetical protein
MRVANYIIEEEVVEVIDKTACDLRGKMHVNYY